MTLLEVDPQPWKRLAAEASGWECRVRTNRNLRDRQCEQVHRSLEAGIHSLSADVTARDSALVGDKEQSVPGLDPLLQHLLATGKELHIVRVPRVDLPA